MDWLRFSTIRGEREHEAREQRKKCFRDWTNGF